MDHYIHLKKIFFLDVVKICIKNIREMKNCINKNISFHKIFLMRFKS